MKSLTARLCLAIAETIESHPEKVDANEIAGCLLTSAAAYAKAALGLDKALIQLVTQMQCITNLDLSREDAHYKVQETLDRAKMIAETDYVDALPAMMLFKG